MANKAREVKDEIDVLIDRPSDEEEKSGSEASSHKESDADEVKSINTAGLIRA